MDIVMARTFNLYGDAKLTSRSIFPGRASEGIEEIKRGRASRIRVGNLESERDYIDVREAVQYYRKIMDKGRCGEAYNVGSGRPLKVREFLAGLLKEAGLGTEVIEEALPSVADETDIPAIYADLTKLKGL
jgi:GDP-4-dehydro-6-deoxy-D-mannose reductase